MGPRNRNRWNVNGTSCFNFVGPNSERSKLRVTMPTMRVFTEAQLRRLFTALAEKFKMTREEEEAWVDHCVHAELRGNLMQGLAYVDAHYFSRFRDGQVVFGAQFQKVAETPSMVVLDAGGALGALAGKRAFALAIEKAKQTGACVVAVRNSNDWMMIGHYTLQAAKQDCIGLAFVNSRPDAAPWGATEAVFGLNPFSVAIPAGRHYPILVDMSSVETRGLPAQEQLILGQMPQGQYYDETGNFISDPARWGTELRGWGIQGAAWRMSSYRDLCLAVMMDALGGALSGMACAKDLGTPEPAIDGKRVPRGQVCIALDINPFLPVDESKWKIDRVIDQAKSARLAPGFSEVLMPGERGFREEQKRRKEGIPIHETVWKSVTESLRELGIDAEDAVRSK